MVASTTASRFFPYTFVVTVGERPTASNDVLARMKRLKRADGTCEAWITSGPYTEPPVEPPNGVPQSYNNDLWLEAPFTDGRRVFALVHNEFHGERTAPPGEPSIYCTVTQQTPPAKQACGYWNIVGAASFDGGRHFALRKQQAWSPFNAPQIALATPYLTPAENGGVNPPEAGMTAQSNIIRWGRYFYVLVQQVPSSAPPAQAGAPQTIGANGVCIYRTEQLGDRDAWRGWNGEGYEAPTVKTYPTDLKHPDRFACVPVLNGMYRFSWSYNVVLHQFIVLGIDTNVGGAGSEAFVSTTVRLDDDGRLTQTSAEHILRQIDWIDRWTADPSVTGEAYPSLLDPSSWTIASLEIPNPTPGDLNFQYSAAHPYLYYTRLNPRQGSPSGTDRDVVRERLTIEP